MAIPLHELDADGRLTLPVISNAAAAGVGGGGGVAVLAAAPVGVAATDTAAINAAIAKLPASGGVVQLQAGAYWVNSGAITIPANVTLMGCGWGATTISNRSATGDVFFINGSNVTIRDLFIASSSVTRTAGYDINMVNDVNTFRAQIINVRSFRPFGFIHDAINLSKILHCQVDDIQSGGVGVLVDGFGSPVIDDLVADNSAPSNGITIQITSSGATLISNCNLIHANTILDINPSGGSTVSAVYAINSYFDRATAGALGNGVTIRGAGNVQFCHFTNCWMNSASNHGVSVNNTGAGSHGLTFTNCDVHLNGGNGFDLTQFAGHIEIDGCSGGQNGGSGIAIGGANTPDYSIVGGKYGSQAGLTGNVDGIFIGAGTVSQALICNVNLHGNTGTNFSNGGTGVVTANNITA